MRIKRGETRPSSDRRLWDMHAIEASELARKMPPGPKRNGALKRQARSAALPMRMEPSLPNEAGRAAGRSIPAWVNSYSRAGLHNGVNQLR